MQDQAGFITNGWRAVFWSLAFAALPWHATAAPVRHAAAEDAGPPRIERLDGWRAHAGVAPSAPSMQPVRFDAAVPRLQAAAISFPVDDPRTLEVAAIEPLPSSATARGLSLPEPGPWSAGFATLTLALFFFARRIA